MHATATAVNEPVRFCVALSKWKMQTLQLSTEGAAYGRREDACTSESHRRQSTCQRMFMHAAVLAVADIQHIESNLNNSDT